MMRALLATALLAALGACAKAPESTEPAGAGPTGIRFLADGASGDFARALEPRAFRFPEDHGAHPDYRTEWWYFTGNLAADGGQHFGFELTFFRLGLSATAPVGRSAWATRQAWMAHFAVTDTERERFHAEERFARGALGLAGAGGTPLRVWVESWAATFTGAESGEIRLSAAGDSAELELELHAVKPPVAHGTGGLDAKGPEPGNASYYYSLPRLEAHGTLAIDGERFDVTGLAWMDREWGTSALSPGIVGWDWFALQLADGRDLMWYRLRAADGSTSPFSGGSLIGADGTRQPLDAADAMLEPLRVWTSAATGVAYPVSWRLLLPEIDLDLVVRPTLDAQELALSVRYWEGAVRVEGTSGAAPIEGSGYLELAGY